MNGKYTILHPLGKGGMGAIYLAGETIASRQRQVVVKEMLEYYDPADPQGPAKAQKRFETEAATLVSLSSPGIPQIFDYFSDSGRNYIVMQFIQGRNLESGLTHLDDNDKPVSGKPYSPEQVRQWGIQVCKVLEYLAGQNVIHMDIKPANLIVDQSDNVWLVDFGTAKAQWVALPGGQVGLKKSSVYGTLGYAPPEQSAGRPEHRSDVFALAATLYHLLTDDDPGAKPYAFSQMSRIPPDIASALRPALEGDVNRRIPAARLRRLLDRHPANGPVFHWQDGTAARDPQELAHAADQRWEEARAYFISEAWEKWLKDLHRNDLAAQLKAMKGQAQNIDLQLDAFLRLVDPNYPHPRLKVASPRLVLGTIPWREKHSFDLEIHNAGSGCLKGSFLHLPRHLQVCPAEFCTHDRQVVQIILDTAHLAPRSHPHTLPFLLDAGTGGRQPLILEVSIPEPQLVIDPLQVNLGPAYHGQVLKASLMVSNAGASLFAGSIRSPVSWLTVEPSHFRCLPGKSKQIDVSANTSELGHGEYNLQLEGRAQATGWEQVQPLSVRLLVSWHRTFWKYYAPALAWFTTWIVGTAGAGWLLGILANQIQPLTVTEVSSGAIVGMLAGLTLCGFVSAIFAGFGIFGNQRGREPAVRGAMLGALLGAITGGVSGLLVAWLGLNLSAGIDIIPFSTLVGALVGFCLGIIFWLLPT